MDKNSTVSSESYVLPPEPVKPSEEDCCGNGCQVCVFDLYELDLKKWRITVNQIKNNVKDDVSRKFVFTDLEYRPFVIVAIETLGDNLIRFDFEIPCDEKLNIREGQHLFTRAFENHSTIVRPYTPVIFNDDNRFIVYVQLYENGRMSEYMKSRWLIGSSVEWRGPFGEYEYKPNEVDTLYMICGGTGIAPMLSIIPKVLNNELDETEVYLLYSTKHGPSTIAKRNFIEWRRYWNFNVRFFLTHADVDKRLINYNDDVILSRINEKNIGDIIYRVNKISKKFLICGSKDFIVDMKNLLIEKFHRDSNEIFCF